MFDYVVAAGDDTAALTISSADANGSIVSDTFGPVAKSIGFHPFAALSASNPNPNAILTVQASVPDLAGTCTHLGFGSMAADGVTYMVTGTAAQVNAVLLSPAGGASSADEVAVTLSDADQTQPSQLTGTGKLASSFTAAMAGERLQGGQGSDTLMGTATDVVIHAGSGPTTVISAAGGTTLIGLDDAWTRGSSPRVTNSSSGPLFRSVSACRPVKFDD